MNHDAKLTNLIHLLEQKPDAAGVIVVNHRPDGEIAVVFEGSGDRIPDEKYFDLIESAIQHLRGSVKVER